MLWPGLLSGCQLWRPQVRKRQRRLWQRGRWLAAIGSQPIEDQFQMPVRYLGIEVTGHETRKRPCQAHQQLPDIQECGIWAQCPCRVSLVNQSLHEAP